MGRGVVRSVFQNLSFGSRSQAVTRERTEPRLLPASAPLEFRRPANANPGILSASREQAPKSAIAPTLSLVERHVVSPSAPVPGSVRSLAVAGCVAFAIAGIASAGFLWLRTTPSEPASPVVHGSAEASQTENVPVSASPVPATTHAVAAIPGPVPPPRTVSSITAPKPPGDFPHAAPETAAGNWPRPVMRRERTASPHRMATSTTTQQRHAAITAGAASDHRVIAPAPALDRPPRLRTEARRTHVRPAHDVQSPQSKLSALHPPTSEAARPSRTAETSTVQPPNQVGAFDQLLANLTGSAKPAAAAANQGSAPPAAGSAAGFDQLLAHMTGSEPADRASGQTLTPPAAGSPDPFAQHTPAQ
jgi:hypothetical protein